MAAALIRAAGLALAVGCAPLPALITASQVRAVLPPALVESGTRCAARLNAHVRGARGAQGARTTVTATAGALGATGAALRGIDGDGNVALGLALGGVALGLLTELVVRLVADPADLLARHGRGLASWDAARHGGDAEDLERCTRDEAPPRLALPAPAEGSVAP